MNLGPCGLFYQGSRGLTSVSTSACLEGLPVGFDVGYLGGLPFGVGPLVGPPCGRRSSDGLLACPERFPLGSFLSPLDATSFSLPREDSSPVELFSLTVTTTTMGRWVPLRVPAEGKTIVCLPALVGRRRPPLLAPRR